MRFPYSASLLDGLEVAWVSQVNSFIFFHSFSKRLLRTYYKPSIVNPVGRKVNMTYKWISGSWQRVERTPTSVVTAPVAGKARWPLEADADRWTWKPDGAVRLCGQSGSPFLRRCGERINLNSLQISANHGVG